MDDENSRRLLKEAIASIEILREEARALDNGQFPTHDLVRRIIMATDGSVDDSSRTSSLDEFGGILIWSICVSSKAMELTRSSPDMEISIREILACAVGFDIAVQQVQSTSTKYPAIGGETWPINRMLALRNFCYPANHLLSCLRGSFGDISAHHHLFKDIRSTRSIDPKIMVKMAELLGAMSEETRIVAYGVLTKILRGLNIPFQYSVEIRRYVDATNHIRYPSVGASTEEARQEESKIVKILEHNAYVRDKDE